MRLAAAGAMLAIGLPGQHSPVHLPPAASYTVQGWHIGNGLPQNSIGDVLQTRDGFVWVGTFGGLCRFDGTGWKVFDTSTSPGLGGNRVWTLFEDAGGELWVGTERGGVARGRAGEFTTEPGFAGQWVGTIARLADGRLLVSSERDLFHLRPEGGFRPVFDTPLPGVRKLLEIDGVVHAFGAAGVHRFGPAGAERISPLKVDSASRAPDGTVYVGTNKGLRTLAKGELLPVPASIDGFVHAVRCTRDGRVWYSVGHLLGCHVPGAPEASFQAETEAPVRCLEEDAAGGLWVGLLGSGVARLQRAEVRQVGAADGLSRGGQNCVAPDGEGGVYVGTYEGLFRSRKGRFLRVPGVESPVTSLFVESDGTAWIGLPDRLASLHAGQLQYHGQKGIGLLRCITRIDGEIWAAASGGLFALRGGELVPLHPHPELDADYHLIAPGHAGEVWVASAHAVARLAPDRSQVDVFHARDALPIGELRGVLLGPRGRTWLALYGGGFVAIERGATQPSCVVDRRHGLLDHFVCAVLDVAGAWVVGSNRGPFVVDAHDLDALADGRSSSLSCRPLAGPLGASAETAGGLHPSAAQVAGEVYLTSVDRLLRIDAAQFAGPEVPPVCYVDKVLAGEDALEPRAVVDAAPGERAFVFRLGACEFDLPQQVRFRWRLLPRDAEWSVPGYGHEAQFVIGEPGEYHFEAQAMTNDALPGPTVAVDLRVPPLWWEFLSVQLGAVATLLLLGWLAFRHGARRAAARQSLLQRLVDERTTALRHAHENLEERVRDRTSELQRALVQIEADHAQRRTLERELELLRRMESLGQLAGGVAHDFNNLLTIVIGNAELLAIDVQDRPGDADLVARIREAGERGRRLTRHLLAVASRQPIAPGIVDGNQQLAAAADMLRQLVGSRIAVDIHLAASPARLRAAPSQLEQILMNLAVNARDAMPDGGTLSIRFDVADGRVLLCVTDTGVGMTTAVRERAFEPFFTTKGKHRGTGLGLATVYGITKQMNGDVEVDSAPGRGTTFRFRWPLASEAAAEPTVVLPAAVAPPHRTVLLIDDEADVRGAIRQMLERAGCTVVEAADGIAAQRALQADPTGCEVVLSDVRMPGPVGVDLVHLLRQVRPGLPFVFATGHADLDAVRAVVDEGFEVLQKPLTQHEVLAALARAGAHAARSEPPVAST